MPKQRQDGLAPRDQQLVVDEPEYPPTDFQRFAMGSVGEVLPIFGANLFRNVPTTFAPVDRIPVTADYVVGPGDEILLRIWGQVNADLELTVDRAGGIFVPQVGNLSIAGLPFGKLPSFLRSKIGRVFRNFDLDVNMGQLRSVQVFVVGQARHPGSYTVSALSTMLNALFASGGPLPQGSMRRIQLKRGAQVVSEFDLYDLLFKGDKSKDQRLLPGDVIHIPAIGPQIALAGSVRNPAIYELNGEANLASAVEMAGGLAPTADLQHATIERIDKHSTRKALSVPMPGEATAVEVADGDVLYVPTITPRFENTVTLRGKVANPGRFPWRDGMRLRDLIPDKRALLDRRYWEQRNSLGNEAVTELSKEKDEERENRLKRQERELATSAEREAQDEKARLNEQGKKRELTKLADGAPELNWSYAVIERQRERDLATELIPFHLGKLLLDGDETQNLELRPSDVVTIFSQDDIRVASDQQTITVRLEGEFAASGVYTVHPGETLGQLIQRAGGLSNKAYLYAAELLRNSTRIDQQKRIEDFTQNLNEQLEKESANRAGNAASAEEAAVVAKRVESERQLVEKMKKLKATGRVVLNLDPDSNDLSKLMSLQLENGDQFLVPRRPSTVNVVGAVYNQNSFLYEQQRRVSDYVRQAGGPTRTADQGHLFVIRADGSVSPKTGFNPFTKSFEASRLNPGDSVVMPELLFKTTLLKGLRDWSQVFGQLALGAAAINVLR